jgi:signal transduction histidine kinase/ligand-binding sensor domain-containing protein
LPWRLAAALALLAALPVSAEPAFEFDHWSIADGLSQSTISGIAFDHDGVAWLATLDGLDRFDGQRFTVYQHHADDPSSLPHDHVQTLLVDAQGTLWLATRDGLARRDRATGAFARWSPPGAAMAPQVVLAPSRGGAFWIGGRGEVLRVDPREDLVLRRVATTNGVDAPVANTEAAKTILALAEGAEGLLWIGTEGGLLRLAAGQPQAERVLLPGDVPQPLVNNILADGSGRIWVATEGAGLFCWESESWRRWQVSVDPAQGLGSDAVNEVLEDRLGRIWVGTANGLSVFEPGLQSLRKVVQEAQTGDAASGGLRSPVITSMALDPQGGVWVGTQGGLHRLRRPNAFGALRRSSTPGLTKDRGLTNDRVWSIRRGDGRLFVGSDGGLDVFDAETGERRRQVGVDAQGRNGLRQPTVRSLLVEEDRVWIGTDGGGVALLWLADGRVEDPFAGLPSRQRAQVQRIRALHRDRRGVLWLALLGHGLARWDPANGLHVYAERNGAPSGKIKTAALSGDRPYCLLEGPDGLLWVGYLDAGIDLFDPVAERVVAHLTLTRDGEAGAANSVTALQRTAGQPGKVLVASLAGVYQLDEAARRLERLPWSWLPNDTVYGVFADRRHRLWVATNNGLARHDPLTGHTRVFTVADGLASNEFNGGAGYQDEAGRIYLGGPSGLVHFQPEEVPENAFVPPVRILGARVFDRALPGDVPNPWRVGSEESFLTFEFAALNYEQPTLNRYAYRLVGFDRDWVESGTKAEASYGNLAPGSYRFEVRGANNDGLWNPTPATIDVVVLPPFWRSGWVLASYGVLLAAGLAFGIRRHGARLRREKLLLERKVRERTGELEAMVDRLRRSEREAQAASQAKAEFLANMSHEIRTPLNAVLGMTGLLLRSELDTRQQTFARTIRTSGNALLALLSDILDFSKIDSGKLDLELLPFDLRDCVADSLEMVAPAASDKPLRLVSEIAEHVPRRIAHDLTRLRQVLLNLLSNAVKFTPAGEVLLRVDGRPLADGRWELRFEVRDTGIGIPAHRVPSLFDSFTQVDSSTTRRFGGTGLGLAISRQLVEKMGGELSVESEPEVGSSFVFTIVAAAAGPELASAGGVAPGDAGLASAAAGLAILIAEDNQVNQLVTVAMLEQLGGGADVVENGVEALRALHRRRYDVVLMDVQMPEMDGIGAARRIREDLPAERQPYIVALTAGAFEADRERCLAAGMDEYLTKPIAIESLAEALRHARK